MRQAKYEEKNLIVDILTQSFESNQSVNYIIPQDKKRIKRIRALMDYSFEVCYLFGDVFISDDNNGFKNIKKTLSREALIQKVQPKKIMTYLWFIGVNLTEQNKGIGSKLLQEIIQQSVQNNRPIYLETSTIKNLPWYRKFGFNVYSEQDLTYHLYFLERD